MRWKLVPGLAALLVLLTFAGLPGRAPAAVRADGSGSLGQSLIVQQAGGYATGGVGFCPGGNCAGGGTVMLSGVPAGSTVTHAFLYWVTIQGTAAAPVLPRLDALRVALPAAGRQLAAPTSSGVVNGQPVTGALIGNQVTSTGYDIGTYRAALPAAAIPAGVNGAYVLSGFPAASAGTPLPPFAPGAQVVVVYANAAAPVTQVVVNDGLAILGGLFTPEPAAVTTTLGGLAPATPPLTARTTFVVAGALPASGDAAAFNGAPVGGANPFRATSGEWWDSVTVDVSALIPPGATSATATASNTGPVYLFWAAQVLALSGTVPLASPTPVVPPPPPPPPPPPIPEGNPALLFGSGLGGLLGYAALRLRRLRRR
jgi:hypothetical protein